MTIHPVVVRDLSKTYRVPERETGLRAAVKSLWSRTYRSVEAVKDINFTIEAGEIVGFLGPNGAGKTTTLKMLSGLLYPSSGGAYVAGFVPWQRKREYLRSIGIVMGNKSQMLWDIPARDTFRVLAEIYQVPQPQLKQTLDELIALLDMQTLLNKPVRTLSLGERMKCELVATLLYRPKILFLDEPSLGLDITMQRRLRRFIADYNKLSGATVLLTSHYMADVEALCPRVIMINRGQLLYDGALRTLLHTFAPYKLVRVVVDESVQPMTDVAMPSEAKIVSHENATWMLHIPQAYLPEVAAYLLSALPVVDLIVEDPPIESVIDQLYCHDLDETETTASCFAPSRAVLNDNS